MKYPVGRRIKSRAIVIAVLVGLVGFIWALLSLAEGDHVHVYSEIGAEDNGRQGPEEDVYVEVFVYQRHYFEGSFETSQTGLNGWHLARDQAWAVYSGKGSSASESAVYGVGQFGDIWAPWYGGWICVYGGGYYLARYTIDLDDLSEYGEAKLVIEYYGPQLPVFELWNNFHFEVYIGGEKAGEGLINSPSGGWTEIPLDIDKVQTGSDVEVLLKSNRFKESNPLPTQYAGYSFRGCEGIVPGPMWLVLEPGGSIAGCVRFEDGTPFANVEVQALIDDEEKGVGTTDDEGYYEIEGLPPETYRVRACFNNAGDIVCNYHNKENPSEADVEVIVGEQTSNIDIKFPLPVVMVHGWNANASNWNSAIDYFQDDPATRTGDMMGTKAHICFAANNLIWFLHISTNAKRLRSYINSSVYSLFSPSLPLINIVAHSMGGLIARKYIHHPEYTEGYNVDKLLMLGTPNAGVKRAIFLFWVPAAGDMTISAMRKFNSTVWDEKYATFYYVAGRGGNDGWEAIPPAGCAYPYKHTDGSIGEWSVFKCINLPEYCLTNAKHNDLRDNQLYMGNILKILEGKTFSSPCNQPLAGAEWSGYQEENIQLSGATSDSIFQGETKQYQFVVDACERTTLTVNWVFGELNLILRDPNGSVIDSSTAAGDTNIQYQPYDSADMFSALGYIIKQPLPGAWTLEVSGVNAPGDSAILFFTMVTLENDLCLSITTDKENYAQGGSVSIAATLSENGVPKTGATVYAKIMKPNYSIDSLGLFDDGAHNDGSADDGVYANSYINTSMGGRYSLSVTASGVTSSEDEFARHEMLEFDVNPNTAHFAGSYSDQGVDVDEDGYFDSLRIEIGVEIDSAGDYEIVASLLDSDDTEIDVANYGEIGVTAGTHTFALDFDGQKIRENGVDGPYYLKNLILVDETEDIIEADFVSDAYTTSPYSVTQFTTSVEQEPVERPRTFALYQSYPNPFNVESNIRYLLPRGCFVKLTIYNILGEKVRVLVNEHQDAGDEIVRWDGRNENGNAVASGIYFYRLKAGNFTETKKMVLLK